MANTYRIQVITKEFIPEVGTEYQDAQYFDVPVDMTIEQFQAEKEAEINAEKEARIQRYVDAVKNPPPVVEPTKEELMAQKAEIQASLDAQIAELDVKIAAKDVKPVDEKPIVTEEIK